MKFDLISVYSAYKKANPDDTVRPSDFAEVIDEVFPGARNGKATRGLEPRSPKAADNVSSIARLQLAHADLDAAAETPQKVQRDSRKMNFDPIANFSRNMQPGSLHNAPQSSKGNQDGSITGSPALNLKSSRQLPWSSPMSNQQPSNSFQRTANERNGKGLQVQRSIPSTPVAPPKEPRIASLTTPSMNHVDPMMSISNDKFRKTNHALRNTSEPQISVFAEFARAWANVQPGGAFASKESRSQRKQASKLDVLAWEL